MTDKIKECWNKAYDKAEQPSGFCDCGEEAISSLKKYFFEEINKLEKSVK